MGWAVYLVVPLVAACKAHDVCNAQLPRPIACDSQHLICHIQASGFSALAGLLGLEASDDVIEVGNLRGGRVEHENEMVVGGRESIGQRKDNVLIRDCNPDL